MQTIKNSDIAKEVKNLLIEANFNLPADIVDAIKKFRVKETNATARKVLGYILENEEIARCRRLPLCQDCGTVYINLTVGSDVCIEDMANLNICLNQEVAEVYEKCYFRKSIVSDPLFDRKNTFNNTPAVIDICFNSGAGISIEVNLKGGGSENCSYLFTLNPSSGEDEILEKVVNAVKENVTKCCPPGVVGIGIGSTSSEVTKLARKAVFRNLNVKNSDARYRRLEDKILKEINSSGIGPQGLGGKTTALSCNIEYAPCHMATLPLAVFLGCHSVRRASSNIFSR